ncbi:hypothetical protein RRG08_028974 [Elysia crispata]|uniref:Uncharacterized protein n=1 Tax=Elysia crispata TaxID=231223 RepID=A0AAE1BEM5_9GAST|nr:hypothetical protein RRG08_028974 [Elysia crispata]
MVKPQGLERSTQIWPVIEKALNGINSMVKPQGLERSIRTWPVLEKAVNKENIQTKTASLRRNWLHSDISGFTQASLAIDIQRSSICCAKLRKKSR